MVHKTGELPAAENGKERILQFANRGGEDCTLLWSRSFVRIEHTWSVGEFDHYVAVLLLKQEELTVLAEKHRNS